MTVLCKSKVKRLEANLVILTKGYSCNMKLIDFIKAKKGI